MESALVICRRDLRDEFNGNNILYKTEYYLTDLAIVLSGGIRNGKLQMQPSGAGETGNNWRAAFDGINSANIVISRVQEIEESQEVKNVLLAEGYFHRAYWYYKLANQYGDVPLILEETTFPKLDFYSSTRGLILRTMKENLEFAVQWLPETAPPGAVCRNAGRHLLAKYYLALSEFDNAIAITTEIINGSHQLMTDRFGVDKDDPTKNVYWDLFAKENISAPENTEAILVYQDRYLQDGGTEDGSTRMRLFVPGWYRSDMLDPDGRAGCADGIRGEPQIGITGRGIGKFKMSGYHSHAIWTDTNDIRHKWPNTWFMDSIKYNNPFSKYYGQPVQKEFCRDTIKCWDPFMYCKVHVEDEDRPVGAGLNPVGGNTDWYIFRLAETYLLRAEAYVWKNDMASAASDVNIIRARVNAAPLAAGNMSIETILDERARELFFECPRKSELTRISFIMAENGLRGYSLENISQSSYWYDRVQTYNEYYRTGYEFLGYIYGLEPYNILWPVPEDAIASNSQGTINQNEGYIGSENNVPPLDEIP